MLSVNQLNFILLLSLFSFSFSNKIDFLKKVRSYPINEYNLAQDWVCGLVNEANFAFRLDKNGDAECYSTDGRYCHMYACSRNDYLLNKNPRAIKCKNLNSQSQSMCELVKKQLDEYKPGPAWVCGISGNQAFRINSEGHVECFSYNGRNCEYNACRYNYLLFSKNPKTLQCTDELYTNPKSICGKVKNALTLNPDNKDFYCGLYKDWAFKLVDEKAHCWSSNGRTCDYYICNPKYRYKMITENSKALPLTCKETAEEYEIPNSACSVQKKLLEIKKQKE